MEVNERPAIRTTEEILTFIRGGCGVENFATVVDGLQPTPVFVSNHEEGSVTITPKAHYASIVERFKKFKDEMAENPDILKMLSPFEQVFTTLSSAYTEQNKLLEAKVTYSEQRPI